MNDQFVKEQLANTQVKSSVLIVNKEIQIKVR